jgi:hypothetical protein
MSRKPADSEFMQLEDLDINSSLEGFQNVFTAGEFTEQVLDFRQHGVNRDAFFPFWDREGDKFALRPREVTILFGSRGSYKSTVANYLVADYVMHKIKAGYISYEMDTPYLLSLMANQLANNSNPTDGYVEKCMALMDDYLYVINEMVDKPHAAIAKVNHMLNQGCKLIVLDCLQRITMPMNDLNLERDFVVELTNLVRTHNAHLILVHHSRKTGHSDGDNPRPVIDDLKGSGGLADNSMNVVAVWSNKKKKDRQFWLENGAASRDDDVELLAQPDVTLMVKKQRLSGFESNIGLWRTDARAFHTKNGKPFTYRPELEG